MKWGWIIAVLLCLVIGFFITDCSSGKAGMEEAQVNGRYYVPSNDWWSSYTDSDGNVHMQHHHDDPQWRVTFDNGMDLDVGSAKYHALKEGQHCLIAYRVGHWTKIQYLKNIRLDLNTKTALEQ